MRVRGVRAVTRGGVRRIMRCLDRKLKKGLDRWRCVLVGFAYRGLEMES
jgi:hypothetical protein